MKIAFTTTLNNRFYIEIEGGLKDFQTKINSEEWILAESDIYVRTDSIISYCEAIDFVA